MWNCVEKSYFTLFRDLKKLFRAEKSNFLVKTSKILKIEKNSQKFEELSP